MARLTLVVLLLSLAAVALGFVPPTPQMDRAVKTRVHSWFGGKKAKEAPAAPAKGAATQKSGMRAFSKKPEEMKGNKRPTAMDYRGMVVSKDEEVIVPATEYFSGKQDVIVPTLFFGLFIPIFGLLGWWLLSPTPEPEIVNPNQTDSYEQMINKGKSVKARRF